MLKPQPGLQADWYGTPCIFERSTDLYPCARCGFGAGGAYGHGEINPVLP